jgi:RHS repeat-associated protein
MDETFPDFTVDPWGNLIDKTVTKCTAETLSSSSDNRNRLAAAVYDSAGNVLTKDLNSYTYDGEGQMTSGAGATYTYDGMGERVAKPGVLYWKGVGGTALVETDGTGANPVRYIFFGGARIARLDPGASSPHYTVSDAQGTTSLVTDASGNVLNDSLYFPYGTERVIANADAGNHYKFTGKERDSTTGLDDFGARFYASNIGRFMSPDWDAKPATVPYASFGDPQTLNLYAYVENAPLNKVDADGHAPGQPVPVLYSIFDYYDIFDTDQNVRFALEMPLRLVQTRPIFPPPPRKTKPLRKR